MRFHPEIRWISIPQKILRPMVTPTEDGMTKKCDNSKRYIALGWRGELNHVVDFFFKVEEDDIKFRRNHGPNSCKRQIPVKLTSLIHDNRLNISWSIMQNRRLLYRIRVRQTTSFEYVGPSWYFS
ncbi:uncharacterized protein [Fopius arisanus]|uniref:Uncharacterized protein isoform X2 n=1 Tax=Fopius arisanus TaxID=64838 RepID=A0A9R1U8T8_9HYME|nr:PREDICTED: uncharacterized protein LOC105272683 isoform X2 [Fopius arisanus]